jgi:hypothetical protein
MSFTSGPWLVAKHLACFDGDQVLSIMSEADGGGMVVWPSGLRNTDNAKANARLIAAAPELLAFADRVFRNFYDAQHPGSLESSMRDEAKALIAKATGVQP